MDELVNGVLWLVKCYGCSVYVSNDLVVICRNNLFGGYNEYEGNIYKGSKLALFVDGYKTPTLDEFLNVKEPSEEIKQEISFKCKPLDALETVYKTYTKVFELLPYNVYIIGTGLSVSLYVDDRQFQVETIKLLLYDNKFIITFEPSCFYGERLRELNNSTDEQIRDALTPCFTKSAKK